MVANLSSANTPAIGTVQSLQGRATAVDASGVERTLQAGDLVYADDIVRAASDSKLVVQFLDGSSIHLSGESVAKLDADVFDPAEYIVADAADSTASIDAIQQAIEAGQDPTQIEELEPTAAGGTTEDGGHSTVVLDLTGGRTDPTSGFETTGLTQSFNDIGELLFNEPLPDSDEPVDPEPPTVEPPPPPPENTPPSGELGPQSNLDSDVINLDISGAFDDADGDTLSYTATGLPPGLSIDSSTGVISGTITASASDGTDDDNNTQDYNVTVTVNDGTVDVDVPFTWTVDNTIPEFLSGTDTVDTAPNADSYSFSADEGTAQNTVIGAVSATDADGDTLTYSITGGNDGNLFAIDPATGAISVTQTIDDAQVGNYNLTVQVIDSEGGVDTADVAVNLVEVPVSSALLITNTNVEVQTLRVNVTSASGTNTTGVVEPTDVQGQEGSNLEFQDDLTFLPGESYTVSIEHISGPEIILTDLSVSDSLGNILNIYEGNAKLDSLDSGNNTNHDGYIFNVQIGADFVSNPSDYSVSGAIGYEVDASGVLVLDTEGNNSEFSLDFSELDLNEPDDLFGDVEELDISGKGTGEDNSVTISAQDVLDLGADDGSDTSLIVSGDIGDVLNLVDDDGLGGAGAWSETASGGGTVTYTYSNGTDIATVIVDDALTVNANLIN